MTIALASFLGFIGVVVIITAIERRFDTEARRMRRLRKELRARLPRR